MSRNNRRSFLRQSAALGLGLTFGRGGRAFAANEKIRVACIGVRGRGNSVMTSFAAEPDCAVTHICDVNEATRKQRGAEMKAKTGLMPQLVNDYRDLLNDESVDAFMVRSSQSYMDTTFFSASLLAVSVFSSSTMSMFFCALIVTSAICPVL